MSRNVERLKEGYEREGESLKEGKELFVRYLEEGDIYKALDIKDEFNLPEKFIKSKKILRAAKKSFIKGLKADNFYNALIIQEELNLPKEFIENRKIKKMAEQLCIKKLKSGDIDSALAIEEKFNLSKSFIRTKEIKRAAEQGFIRRLIEGYFGAALEIKEKFNLSKNHTQEIVKKVFIRLLESNHTDYALRIEKAFSFSVSREEIIEEIPKAERLFHMLKKRFPEIYEKAQTSPNLFFSLFRFIKNPDLLKKQLQDYPFLKEAVFANPRFGPKLLTEYYSFDNISKEKIKTLYDIKQQILSEHPHIDPNTKEFRTLMQEHLTSLWNNQHILEELKNKGINIEQWLDYSIQQDFILGTEKEEPETFSQILKPNLQRFISSAQEYLNSIPKLLQDYEYDKDLNTLYIETKRQQTIHNLKEEIKKEQSKPKKNLTKIQRLKVQLQKEELNLKQEKPISVWQHIQNRISTIEQQLTSLTQKNTSLEELEHTLQTQGFTKQLSQRISRTKHSLKELFTKTQKRIDIFKQELDQLLSTHLGKERKDSLIQELNQDLSESLEHIATDTHTINQMFSKKKQRFYGNPMYVSVWNRNPDIDLYQGNYSPCCISIDSKFQGGEVTIADYLTDLGIQVVNIYDKKEGKPIVAAWCWIGTDPQGNIALVVDNIEANTDYSTRYPTQLTQKLFSYLKEYARSINVPVVVLGEVHNDLPVSVSDLSEHHTTYKKTGYYNQRDKYFLEAEDSKVKEIG